MPIPKPLLPYATRAVADLRPRDSQSLNLGAEIGSILGGIFGGLALLVAVIFGILQIRRWAEEDRIRQLEHQRLNNKWYRKLRRKLWPWGLA